MAKKVPEKSAETKFGHQQGLYSVFERNRDGSIEIAPMYITAFDRIMARTKGVQDLVDRVSKFASDEFASIAADRSDWWKRVMEDVGIEGPEWSINTGTGTLIKKNQETKKEEK